MIYIVEDDRNIQEIELFALKNSGYQATGFETAKEFYKALNEKLPELILLDIMLPEEDGLTILERLKNSDRTKNIPVIMLTAKGSEIDKVKGFEKGADDYIAKPFGMMELVARVKARLRGRSNTQKEQSEYSVDCLYVCPDKHIVTVNGRSVALTLKEFEMLCMLLKNCNVVLTRDQILNKIWGYSFDGESRTVDVHVRTLRQKLGEAGTCIETVRGVGYRMGDES